LNVVIVSNVESHEYIISTVLLYYKNERQPRSTTCLFTSLNDQKYAYKKRWISGLTNILIFLGRPGYVRTYCCLILHLKAKRHSTLELDKPNLWRSIINDACKCTVASRSFIWFYCIKKHQLLCKWFANDCHIPILKLLRVTLLDAEFITLFKEMIWMFNCIHHSSLATSCYFVISRTSNLVMLVSY